ncbi:MAG: hypothetical protein FWH31_04440 [Streptococcaceae bacterium]|nr:hypothetical protein [Streptococcaceae bacterium]
MLRIEGITSSVGDSFSPTDVSRTKAKLSAAYPSTKEVGELPLRLGTLAP